VPRPRPADRFERLRDAALQVFTRKGLRRARMSDVARALGVSPGTLYNCVESKQALFHWIVAQGAAPGPVATPARLPIPTPRPGATARRLRRQLAAGFRLPSLEAALRRRRVSDARAELEVIVRELYDRVERTRGPVAMLERSALDAPELFDAYFRGARRQFFAAFTRYVARRARAGHFRPVAEPAVAARWLVETVVLFARHRHADPDPGLLPDDDTVRECVVPLAVASLVPDRRRRKERR
jgi:AcrR family transcriptional regulator